MLSLFFLGKVFLTILLFFLSTHIHSEEPKSLHIQSNKKLYSTGDLIFFKIYLPKNGYAYLLNQKADGTLHLIFPNDEDESNKLNFGYSRLPSKNVDYEWVIDSAYGEELFFLILSDKMIKFFHKKSVLKDQTLSTDNWLRRHTSDLLPWEWKITETKIRVKQ